MFFGARLAIKGKKCWYLKIKRNLTCDLEHRRRISPRNIKQSAQQHEEKASVNHHRSFAEAEIAYC